MSRVRVAVLISGRGSNLEALLVACKAPDFPAEIVLVISNREDAQGLQVAKDAGVAIKVIPHKQYSMREEFDAAIDDALRAANVSLVCEAGFMRIHSEWFVKTWEGRLLNIHPSLLPAFPGIRVHQQALDAGVKISGCTVHFIVPELDSGPIIAQAAVPVSPSDTAGTLAARILVEEHRIYPEALKLVAAGKVKLKNGKAVFLPSP
ncbi:MAG: phosphoribosylglycinamide formyltransferase [Proteobacteria bacterium]|nr:phosphoribosylglycinamide formyltransferase [Pseudomonadota bacterium]